jgi:hypothetical protein
LELDEEQDLTMLAEEWEEPLSSVEGDDDMEIPPLEMSEEEEDLLVDDWQEPAEVLLKNLLKQKMWHSLRTNWRRTKMILLSSKKSMKTIGRKPL